MARVHASTATATASLYFLSAWRTVCVTAAVYFLTNLLVPRGRQWSCEQVSCSSSIYI